MTDEELKALVAENSRAVAENSRAVAENSRAVAENSRAVAALEALVAENSRAVAENSRAIRELRQESEKKWGAWQQESDRRWQEARAAREVATKESERLWQEIQASRQESDRLVTNIHRELGGISRRLGGRAEAMLRPSLSRAMREQFKAPSITSPQRAEINGESIEIDMVAHAGSESDEVYLVEMKSRLTEWAFEQLAEHLRKFPRFFPQHRGKKLFGVLAALEIPPHLAARAHKEGIYLATIKDDLFEIVPPDGFVPHAFGLRGLS